jgi:exopolysaccharide/PEP-CTERM locus tyrosine autokinase
MSRIDQAIQKAALLRETPSPAAPVTVRSTPPASPDLHSLLQSEPMIVDHPCLVTNPREPHPAGEAYKKLKSLILKLTRGETFQNALLVTSATMEEGKSITALNLALTLAREYDHTVLLVDVDLRRPSLHRYLNFEPKHGLIQVLKDHLPLDRALVKTGIGKLVVLPAGGTVEDPVELLASEQMKHLVTELKTRYPDRYVIFDAPPSLHFADAQALGPAVDGVVFVVREGAAKPRQIKAALEGLKGLNLLGVVYNDSLHLGKDDRYESYYYQKP